MLTYFKNLKLSWKMALGFGLIILITGILGMMAIQSMSAVSKASRTVAEKRVPQLQDVTLMERASRQMIQNIQAFTQTREEARISEARQHLDTLESLLAHASTLARNQNLPELQELASTVEKNVQSFRSNLGQMETTAEEIKLNQQAMRTEGERFLTQCGELLTQMNENIDTAIIDEDIYSIDGPFTQNKLLNELRGLIYKIIAETWRAQALNDLSIIEDTQDTFATIFSKLEERISFEFDLDFKTYLQETLQAGKNYEEAMNQLIENRRILETLNNQTEATAQKLLETVASSAGSSMKEVSNSSEYAVKSLNRSSRTLMGGILIALVIAIMTGVTITIGVTRPVTATVDVIKALAAGDLTRSANINQKDELGVLASSVNATTSRLREIMNEFGANASTLSEASMQLSATSQQLSERSNLMFERATDVGDAGEHLSGNIDVMAETANSISSSANNVASSVEEMSASINEVASNCAKESEIAQRAAKKSHDTRANMAKLGDSAREISNVVEIINSIADQTNLLALNATIEAASAGEAGKGFAVVANEVKELARQSADATEQISAQIQAMQQNTSVSIQSISEITEIIEEVNQIASSIASAVEEQSATTNEIAKMMGGVSHSTSELAARVQESARQARDVSTNIKSVSDAAQESNQGAQETNQNARNLTEMAARLQEIVSQFKC